MPGHLTDRELQEIRDRSRRAWNNLIQREEDELRQADDDAEDRRSHIHLVQPGEEN